MPLLTIQWKTAKLNMKKSLNLLQRLTLTLLMLRVTTDHHNPTASTDHPTLVAHFFDGCPYFHAEKFNKTCLQKCNPSKQLNKQSINFCCESLMSTY